jgi:hypothetical protein
MRVAVRVCVLVAAIAVPAVGFAQWLKHPTEGVPRTADGNPNMAAPTPRLPDGKPDFSGIWHATNPNNRCGQNDPGGPFVHCGVEIGGSLLGGNLGRNLPDGLPYLPHAAALAKKRRSDDSRDDPHVRCLPDNPPRSWTLPHLTRAIHTPKLLALLYEVNAMYRQIHIDGRALPVDPTPAWNGYSTARWEGDTLVVQTSGFPDGIWLDRSGNPLTDAARITERIRRVSFGRMEIEVTIDDPKAYTRPWTITLRHDIVLDTELIDYICTENEQDIGHLVGK